MITNSDKQSKQKRRSPPAITIEARENQLIAMAVDLAEKQLRDGTASSQVITHYLKQSTPRERLERVRLEEENKLLSAKTEAIKSSARVEELYKNAMTAFRSYQGRGDEDD